MMRHKTKLLAFILTFALAIGCVLGLTACGNGGNGGNGGSGDNGNKVDETVTNVRIEGATDGVKLVQGQELELTASTNIKAENRKVNWSYESGVEGIVTLTEKGDAPINTVVVKAAADKAGTVKIVATSDGNPAKKAEITIEVKAPAQAIATATQTNKPASATDDDDIAGTLTFYDDGTVKVDAYYNGLGIQATSESTYTASGSTLTIADGNATAFGMTAPCYFYVINAGKITVKLQTAADLEKYTVFELDDAAVAALGLTVLPKVDVTGITLKDSYKDNVIKSGEKLDLSHAVAFTPENASIQDVTVEIDTVSMGVIADATLKALLGDTSIPAEMIDNAIMTTVGAGIDKTANISGTAVHGLYAGKVIVKITSKDNPEASVTTTVTIETVERPSAEQLAANYFAADIRFAKAISGYHMFLNSGIVESYTASGALEDIGYYTLNKSSDADKLVIYSLTDKKAMEYNLRKQDGLWQFDEGVLLGMEAWTAVAQEVSKVNVEEALATHFEADTSFATKLVFGEFELPVTYTLTADGKITQIDLATGTSTIAGRYGLKTEGGKTYVVYTADLTSTDLYSSDFVTCELVTENGKKVIKGFLNELGAVGDGTEVTAE